MCEYMQAGKIDIAPIQDIKRARLQNQLVEDVDVVNFACCDADKTWDTAMQVHQGMDLDRAFALAEMCPRKQRKAEIDRCGIEGVSGLLQGHAEIVFGIQQSCSSNQHLSEIGVNAPVSVLVGFGQVAASGFAPNARMIEFGLQSAQTRFDIPKTFSVSKLSKSHTEELIEAGKPPHPVIAMVSSDTLVEFVLWQKIHQLGENDPSRIHRPLLSIRQWKEYDLKV